MRFIALAHNKYSLALAFWIFMHRCSFILNISFEFFREEKSNTFPLERPDYMFWFDVSGKFPFLELAFILLTNFLTFCAAWDWTWGLLCPDFYVVPLYFLFPLPYLLQKCLEGMWNCTILQPKKTDKVVLPITFWDWRGQEWPHRD